MPPPPPWRAPARAGPRGRAAGHRYLFNEEIGDQAILFGSVERSMLTLFVCLTEGCGMDIVRPMAVVTPSCWRTSWAACASCGTPRVSPWPRSAGRGEQRPMVILYFKCNVPKTGGSCGALLFGCILNVAVGCERA